jgi:hypothetical protein
MSLPKPQVGLWKYDAPPLPPLSLCLSLCLSLSLYIYYIYLSLGFFPHNLNSKLKHGIAVRKPQVVHDGLRKYEAPPLARRYVTSISQLIIASSTKY